MARLAVLASGRGTNFQALAEALRRERPAPARPDGSSHAPAHECVLLIHDRKSAIAAQRAASLGIPAIHIDYAGRSREEAEAEMDSALRNREVDLVALAGFMRLLSPFFVSRWKGRLLNIHPSLLPAWPGKDAIHQAFSAGSCRYGVSVHFVDEGMDTGPLIAQDEFEAEAGECESSIEERVHSLEHLLYPRVVVDILDRIESERRCT